MSDNNNSGRFVKGDPRAKPFQPGTTGNPGGRPKGFTSLIRAETRNGAELVELALMMLRHGNVRQRQWAVEWLSDRGFGRPIQAMAIQNLDEFFKLVDLLAIKARELFGEEAFTKILLAAKAAAPELMEQHEAGRVE